jgi:hypothetical protein
MRNRLADCRKTQNVVIPFTVNVHGEPRHAACRGISLLLGVKRREIPHFVRNDNQWHFFRIVFGRRWTGLSVASRARRLKPKFTAPRCRS